MSRMPGDLSTPPPSPGRHLFESKLETTDDTQTTQWPPDTTTGPTEAAKSPDKLTISTSPMHPSLASLTCATRLSPDVFSASRTNSMEPSVVLTPELLAVGELVSAMKRVVGVLGTTFDSLGEQSARVASLAPALKASEQIKKLQAQIALQIHEHEMRMLNMQLQLDEAVKQTLSEELKAHIHDTVAREVRDRVARELNAKIPENLRQQIKTHKRQILEVQRSLHNSEARQHNSALGPAALADKLRPLLRPLPSAEQSPSTAKPWSVPLTPLPLPVPVPSGGDDTAPTASPLFPRDLKALFALKSEEAQTLVKEYGLGEQAPPITPIVAGTANEPDSRERNLNKFMAHIGVSRRRVPNARLPQLHVVIPGGTEFSVTTYY